MTGNKNLVGKIFVGKTNLRKAIEVVEVVDDLAVVISMKRDPLTGETFVSNTMPIDLKISTLKRHWKALDEEVELVYQDEPDESENKQKDDAEMNPRRNAAARKAVEAMGSAVVDTVEKESTSKTKPVEIGISTPKLDADAVGTKILNIRNIVHTIANKLDGVTIYESERAKGFVSIKVNGSMFMNYTISSKGFTLWLRKAAIVDLPEGARTANHMFDIRLRVENDSVKDIAMLTELIKKSYHYQVTKKNSTKAAKARAKKATAAAKVEEPPVTVEVQDYENQDKIDIGISNEGDSVDKAKVE